MKNVVNFVCSYASIYGGNFIPSLLHLCKKIEAKGDRVIFTFPKEAENRKWATYIQNQGFNIFFIDFKNKFVKSLKLINKKNGTTILYSHFLSGLLVKLIYPFSYKIKLIIHVHSDFSGGKKESLSSKIKRFVEHRLLRRDAVYLYVSKEMSEEYSGIKNHFHLANALCLDRIPSAKLDKCLLKKKYGISEYDTVFLHFGWSPFVKGTDIAFKAFSDAVRNEDNCKLIIVHGRDDGYEKLISFFNNHNLDYEKANKKIILIPPSEDVFSLYELSDVFILSSRSEGFSYSILESLYFNLIVLSSNIPGVQWSKNYENTLFFDDVNGLSKEIKKLSGFKKDTIVNKQICFDYNIDSWSNFILDKVDLSK